MVKFYISWEKYVAKVLFSVIIIFVFGFIFGHSMYFQFSETTDVVFAADVGYGGGGNSYCPTLPPEKSPKVNLSSTDQSVQLGSNVSFTIQTSNFNNPSYSITDSFSNTTIKNSNISSGGSFNWVPTENDVGIHNLIITVKDPCNTINLPIKITVVIPEPLPHPFVPKFPNTGVKGGI
ncbi:MAG: hypothetical protein A3D35_02465 [Candidatus Staskawiczbacteria bacterium RIFCSPHIGHO2_02_FULL_34_9]|uniref:Dystroglycan-type cadherin-like domain-containing protein n=1 Tax=Candidatus Staskawiczbacteria bacterium RIFCSPHIGHO2_02_FULL_34_9 TaxID=1802206 RepID=A0A1G2HYX6_9BACT|nr:MAG: hypothetical protein A3D35_02465 [Candidatus Staskawiczbacteria bacterium RIFCSPHIGHO2_02_FULL_34_9]